MVKPHCLNFRIITAMSQVAEYLRITVIVTDSKESMFGKYGLAMFIAACIVALCLLLVVIYLLLKKKRKRNKDDFMVGDSVPKLKMLEVSTLRMVSLLQFFSFFVYTIPR